MARSKKAPARDELLSMSRPRSRRVTLRHLNTHTHPFMLVNTKTHTIHTILGGFILTTACGIHDISIKGPMWKYQQRPRGSVNCLGCIAAGDG